MQDHLDTHFILNCKANRNTDRGHNRNWFIRVDVPVRLYTIPLRSLIPPFRIRYITSQQIRKARAAQTDIGHWIPTLLLPQWLCSAMLNCELSMSWCRPVMKQSPYHVQYARILSSQTFLTKIGFGRTRQRMIEYICVVLISFRGYWFFPWQIYHAICDTEAVTSANNLLAARLRNELASGSRGGTPEVHSSRSISPKHGARSPHSPLPQSKPGGTKREVENEDACLKAHDFNSIHRQLHWDRSVHSIVSWTRRTSVSVVCVCAVFVSFPLFWFDRSNEG